MTIIYEKMIRRVYHRCYVCNAIRSPQQLSRINEDEEREVAIMRRESLRHPPMELNDESRLCMNCRQSIAYEIATLQANPLALRLNVVSRPRNGCCLICHNVGDNMSSLSISCRVNIFVECNIYVPENVKSCNHHTNDEGFLPPILIAGLRAINRPYEIKGPQLTLFLQQLQNIAKTGNKFINYQTMSDEDFKVISPIDKNQFEDLFNYCEHVDDRNIDKRDLLMFLCKLRQGLSDHFLKIVFNYSSRQAVSIKVAAVRQSLNTRFVQQNVGFQSISRNEFIARHVTEFSNELYNSESDTPRAVAIIDATYAYVHRSMNFQVLRQSFSLHKKGISSSQQSSLHQMVIF